MKFLTLLRVPWLPRKLPTFQFLSEGSRRLSRHLAWEKGSRRVPGCSWSLVQCFWGLSTQAFPRLSLPPRSHLSPRVPQTCYLFLWKS